MAHDSMMAMGMLILEERVHH